MNEAMKNNEQYMEALPAADIIDSEKEAVISLEVPGANAKTVSVEVKDQILKVEAKSSLTYHGMPLIYKRSFQLSDAIDVEKITARTQDGILTVTLPKSERAKVHRIMVE